MKKNGRYFRLRAYQKGTNQIWIMPQNEEGRYDVFSCIKEKKDCNISCPCFSIDNWEKGASLRCEDEILGILE